MAIANYEDRFVIPTAHREFAENTFDLRGGCGFTFGNGCSDGRKRNQPVRRTAQGQEPDGDRVMKTLKVLSALLGYPTQELIDAVAGICGRPRCRKGGAGRRRQTLDLLIEEIAVGELYDLQERYGLLFDRSKTLSLHLFEHVHGESRDRGQAMVDLKAMYEKAELFIATNELPDYVPLFLEFLSTQSLAEARELLGQTAHIFAALAERLERRQSKYKAVFDALVAIAAAAPSREIVDELLKGIDPDPMDLEALDAAWEEEEVRFGPGSRGRVPAAMRA